jgi:hypothetical protein
MSLQERELVNSIWIMEELLVQWKKPIVLPIYKKKVIKNECNYRGMSLLSSSYTILSHIILSRLNPYIHEVTGDHQRGFRCNRSTTDQILIVVECILLLYVINKILTFIPYSQLVLCMYTLYSLHHNMFRLHRAILR